MQTMTNDEIRALVAGLPPCETDEQHDARILDEKAAEREESAAEWDEELRQRGAGKYFVRFSDR